MSATDSPTDQASLEASLGFIFTSIPGLRRR